METRSLNDTVNEVKKQGFFPPKLPCSTSIDKSLTGHIVLQTVTLWECEHHQPRYLTQEGKYLRQAQQQATQASKII